MQQADNNADLLHWLVEDRLETWRQLCSSLQSITLTEKSFVYRQGDLCPHVFLILKGIVKLSHITEQGNEWTIALLKRGDIIGRIETGPVVKPIEETAQIIGKADLIRLDYSDFKTLILQQPDLSWQIFEMQCLRRQQAERKLLDILAEPVQNRTIALLKELALLFGIRCPHGYALEIRLTQQELADLAGASRPVVSTVMNDLRTRGILNYTRELICVNDTIFAKQDNLL